MITLIISAVKIATYTDADDSVFFSLYFSLAIHEKKEENHKSWQKQSNRRFPRRLRHLAKVRLRVAFHRARYKVWYLCTKSLVENSCRLEPADKYIPSTNRDHRGHNLFHILITRLLKFPTWWFIYNNVSYFRQK